MRNHIFWKRTRSSSTRYETLGQTQLANKARYYGNGQFQKIQIVADKGYDARSGLWAVQIPSETFKQILQAGLVDKRDESFTELVAKGLSSFLFHICIARCLSETGCQGVS